MLRLYDNTRLTAFKSCPRKYFFRHIMHWVPQGRATALIFGGAWHAAMDVVWGRSQELRKEELVTEAYRAFLVHWGSNGMPMPDEIDYEMEKELAPRTPGQALEMIVAYVDDRWSRFSEFEVIDIERPFAVPLDPTDDTLFYVGKIDKIVRYRSKIQGLEHKTTTMYKKNGPFRSTFVDSFSPNAQVYGYIYALHMMFPGEVRGVWVDGALVHKQEEGFMFIPIEVRLEQLDSWLWETKWWIGQIESQQHELSLTSVDAKYMKAFPKNTNSCIDYGSACPYMDICKSFANPLGKTMPLGYVEERWDPLSHVPGLDKIIFGEVKEDAN